VLLEVSNNKIKKDGGILVVIVQERMEKENWELNRVAFGHIFDVAGMEITKLEDENSGSCSTSNPGATTTSSKLDLVIKRPMPSKIYTSLSKEIAYWITSLEFL